MSTVMFNIISFVAVIIVVLLIIGFVCRFLNPKIEE